MLRADRAGGEVADPPVHAGGAAATVLWVGQPGDVPHVEAVVRGLGMNLRAAASAAGALAELADAPGAVCLLDCTRGPDTLRIARAVRAAHPRALLVGVVDPTRAQTTLDAFRAGAFDVLPWPLAPWDVNAVLANAHDLVRLATGRAAHHDPVEVAPYGVFGSSPGMRKLIELLPRIGPSRCPVLLYGEPGTGREMLARAIHGHTRRPEARFVEVDCSAASPQELEQELFGVITHRRVDASEERRTLERVTPDSRLVAASGGTLFLTHLPEMPMRVQTKLHRLLRDREATFATDGARVDLDIRPIAAVEPGFESALDEGRLRRDLYERLSLVRLELPPLRQRREDVPFVATHFLKEICRTHGTPIKTLTRSALTLLGALPWRGNAPELRAVLERLVLLTPHGSIRLEDVLSQVRLDGSEVVVSGGTSLKEARLRFERDYIAAVVRQHHGRMGEAAAALGIQRTNLYRKLRQLSMTRNGREPGARRRVRRNEASRG